MSEGLKTASLVGAAALLAMLTWIPGTGTNVPATFTDRNSLLFPEFADPNKATSLEVVEFDERSATPRALKVLNEHGHWTIPSHFNYPADAGDRLAKVAAAIVTLRKEDFAGTSTGDYERLGVLDPLDPALPGVKGRGTRVTVRGENERLLADVLIGERVNGHGELRYVRLPDQKTAYVSRVGDLETSTRFADWIDPDLLQVASEEVDAVNIVNYSFDAKSGAASPREALLIRRTAQDDWVLEDALPGEAIKPATMTRLIDNLVALKIAGVFPKPAGVSAALSQAGSGAAITTADRDDLGRKGFFLTRDGRLLSNEGEVIVHTRGGIFYTLRFGEVAPGEPEARATMPGNGTAPEEPAATRENRYLFVMAAFDPGSTRRTGQPRDVEERRAAALSERFAPWYYIISAESLAQIRVPRRDLVAKARR
jgi:hypothetical protein